MTKQIEFYFDFLSPYSYLAWNNFNTLSFPDVEVVYKPCPLASVIKFYETKGPAEIGPKRNYLFKDCLRKAKASAVEFNIPPVLPFNSLYALRIALFPLENKKELIDVLFKAAWVKGVSLGDEDELAKELNLNGFNSKELLEYVSNKEARVQLKNNVKQALSKGVFGVPSFVIDNELFWGEDSLKALENYIRGHDLLDLNKYNKFLENYIG